jgi:uncharacterized integral membrane protein
MRVHRKRTSHGIRLLQVGIILILLLLFFQIKLTRQNSLDLIARTLSLLGFNRVVVTTLRITDVVIEVTTACIFGTLVVYFTTAADLR